MKVAVMQMPVIIGDREGNQRTLRTMFDEAVATHRPDVVLLPELWDIGYYPKPLPDYADENGESARRLLCALARERHVNIVGGTVAARLGGRVCNAGYVCDREGNLVAEYRKTHLFSPAHEGHAFAAGDALTTFTLDGVVCGALVCYELRFPEVARTLALRGARVLFVAAAWPTVRIEPWQVLNQARAMENQAFVAAANGSGAFANGVELGGCSLLLDPVGEVMARAGKRGAVIAADCDLCALERVRALMPTFDDRRRELYDCHR